MRRYYLWFGSALVAVAVFALTRAAGLPGAVVLLLTFVGAMAGSLLTAYVIGRRQASGSKEGPTPPPGRGSGGRAG